MGFRLGMKLNCLRHTNYIPSSKLNYATRTTISTIFFPFLLANNHVIVPSRMITIYIKKLLVGDEYVIILIVEFKGGDGIITRTHLCSVYSYGLFVYIITNHRKFYTWFFLISTKV